MSLDSNNHSVFNLQYCLVLTIQNRERILNTSLSDRLREIFDSIAPNYNIAVLEWHGEEDYIEVTLKAHPNTELSKFINAYKSVGSRLIKKEYPEVASKMGGAQFWSKSFLLMTLGEKNEVTTGEYLKSQVPGIDRRRRESRKTKEEQ